MTNNGEVVVTGAELAQMAPVTFALFGCMVNATSLEIPPGIEFEDWESLGRDLQYLKLRKEAELRTVKWWIGDWLRFGEHKWGEKYANAVQETGYSEQTLQNIQWVADSVQNSRRREELPFEHHAEVAALPPDRQDEFLDKAVEEKLSRAELRKKVKHAGDRDNGKDPTVGDSERALARALEALAASAPQHWANLIIKGLVSPLRTCCAPVEYEAFLTMMEIGIKELQCQE